MMPTMGTAGTLDRDLPARLILIVVKFTFIWDQTKNFMKISRNVYNIKEKTNGFLWTLLKNTTRIK